VEKERAFLLAAAIWLLAIDESIATTTGYNDTRESTQEQDKKCVRAKREVRFSDVWIGLSCTEVLALLQPWVLSARTQEAGSVPHFSANQFS
jgi:hypothetical protein